MKNLFYSYCLTMVCLFTNNLLAQHITSDTSIREEKIECLESTDGTLHHCHHIVQHIATNPDYHHNKSSIASFCNAPATATTLASTLSSPEGIWADGNGNLYVAVFNGNRVVKIDLNDNNTISDIATGLSSPAAVWGSQDNKLYVGDAGNNRVIEIDLVNNNTITEVTTNPNVHGVWGDDNGFLYVAELSAGNIVQIDLNQNNAATTIASGITSPHGLWGDDNGNLYVTTFSADGLLKIDMNESNTVTSIATGFSSPFSVWGTGSELYVADNGVSEIVKIDLSDNSKTSLSATGIEGAGGIWGTADGELYLSEFRQGETSLISCAEDPSTETSTALHFDGIDDKVNIPMNGDGIIGDFSNPTDFTVEIRFTYTGSGNPSGSIFTKHRSPADGYFAEFNSNGQLVVGMGYTFDFTKTSSSTPLNANQIYHVALVYNENDNAFSTYLDGTLIETRNLPENYIHNSTDPLTIAHSEHYGGFSSLEVDYFRVWNDQRTATEIEDNSGCELIDCDDANLVLSYNFNDGTPDSDNTGLSAIDDCSANANDGTLDGFALTGSTSNFTTYESCTSAVVPFMLSLTGSTQFTEGTGETNTQTYTITRSGNTTGAASVDFVLQPYGTDAADASDFNNTPFTAQTINFADGETTQTVDVSINTDSDEEVNETFIAQIQNISANGIYENSFLIVTVEDDDAPPVGIAGVDILNTCDNPVQLGDFELNEETDPGTGSWSIVEGTGGSFTDANDYYTTFSGTEGTRYKLEWNNGTETDQMFVSFAGDSDNDGVNDCVDRCPQFDDSIDTDMDGAPDACDCDPNSADDAMVILPDGTMMSGEIPSDMYESSGTIESTGIVKNGSDVTYKAAVSITLNAGFQVEAGGLFHAYIAPCTYNPDYQEPDFDEDEVTERFSEPTDNDFTDLPMEFRITAQPNPARDIVQIGFELTEDTAVSMDVFNTMGERIALPMQQQTRPAGKHLHGLNVSHLTTGIYYVRVQTKDAQQVVKIMVQR